MPEVGTAREPYNLSIRDRLGELVRFVHPGLDSSGLPFSLAGAELHEEIMSHELLVLSTQRMLDEVGAPGSVEIGFAAPRQSDPDRVPTAVIAISGMEWLMDVTDEVGQNPDGELLASLGLVRISENLAMARNLCRGAPSVRTVLAVGLSPAGWNVVVVPRA